MSGWGVMTVHPPSGLSGDALEKAERGIEDYLEDYEHSPYDEPAGGYGDRTVQCGDLRSASERGLTSRADTAFEECPYAGRIVIIVAGDTSDAGSYYYFERQEGETVLVDQWHGYGGARGRDAEGRVEEEHGVFGYASYEA